MRSIEAARGIAALMVVLMHSANLMDVPHFSGHVGFGGLFNFGYVGVDFFFVLSGFIISYIHYPDVGRAGSIPVYLWRRFSRIYPIYWIALLFAILVVVGGRVILGKPMQLDLAPIDMAGTLLLIQVAEPKYVGVAWSLQFEVVFYLMYCAILFRRSFGLSLFVIWASAILARVAIYPDTNGTWILSSHSLQFIMGVMIGSSCRRWRLPSVGSGALLAATAAFAAAVLAERTVFAAHGDFGRITLGLASAAILFCLVGLEKQGRIHTPRFLYVLGSVSYSIYLAHITFIGVIYTALVKAGLYRLLPEAAVFMIGAGGAMLASILLGLLVELPLVEKLKPRRVRTNDSLAATPTAHGH